MFPTLAHPDSFAVAARLAADVRTAASDEVTPLDPGLVCVADAVLAGAVPTPDGFAALSAWADRERRFLAVN